MDRLIRSITEHYLGKLDDHHQYFTPDQLLNAGFPEFLVKRIRLELMRNLQDSITPPHSDWADMSADAVTEAWDHFLGAIHEQIRLPASYANPVLESALGDIMELMITPRAFLPDYIFGSETKLDLATVRQRCEWIVVYNYFATAIPRFMEKKKRDILTKEQADRIIERLDERITAHYTSLNWAQLFEPWFTIIGDTVDPGLFARFFRDKGKPGVARLFDAEPEPIHRTRLIEILSKPQLDDDDDDIEEVDEDLASVASGVQRPAETSGMADAGKTHERERIPEKQEHQPETGRRHDDPGEEKAGHKHIEAQKKTSIEHKEDPRKEEGDQEENLLARFRKANGGEGQASPFYSHLNTGYLQKKQEEEADDDRPLYSRLGKQDVEKPEEESIPIWKRFTEYNEEDTDTAESGKSAETTAESGKSAETTAESGKSAKKSTEDTDFGFRRKHDEKSGEGKSAQDAIARLRAHVSDMEAEFVEELFGGDESAFLDALEQISRFKTWKEAGRYISKEIFDRNMIDIYSDMAIYFTDRMQTYFLENEDV